MSIWLFAVLLSFYFLGKKGFDVQCCVCHCLRLSGFWGALFFLMVLERVAPVVFLVFCLLFTCCCIMFNLLLLTWFGCSMLCLVFMLWFNVCVV